jgi:lipoprotein-releasing system ATP-binding protein
LPVRGFERNSVLEARQLTKEYPTPDGALAVLSGVSFSLHRGDAISIVGPSGSGKSTLLYILGGLEPPSSGTVTVDGRDLFALSEHDLTRFRNDHIGFVFQDHCLLPQCSVLENVLIPTLVAGEPAVRDAEARAHWLLEAVGLTGRLRHRPAALSGGEKQRVALARALIREPLLLLCDEPTGNLDRRSADAVASLLIDLHREQQTIMVLVTHSLELAGRVPIQMELVDRCLQSRGPEVHGESGTEVRRY